MKVVGTFYLLKFWNIDSYAIIRNNRKILCSLHVVSVNDNILKNSISNQTITLVQSTHIIQIFQFYLDSFICVYVYLLNSIQFYHLSFILTTTFKILNHNNLSCCSVTTCSQLLPAFSVPISIPGNSTINPFSNSKILSFQKCYIDGIIQCVTFWDWLFYSA